MPFDAQDLGRHARLHQVVPDGLGALDGPSGRDFSLIMNHELRPTQGVPRRHGPIGAFDSIWTIDPKTLDRKWEYKMNDITWGGILSTASDLVFSGGKEGYFFALDARNGALLWKVALGGQINSGPMTYAVNGRQYVTVAAGTSLFTFALKQ